MSIKKTKNSKKKPDKEKENVRENKTEENKLVENINIKIKNVCLFCICLRCKRRNKEKMLHEEGMKLIMKNLDIYNLFINSFLFGKGKENIIPKQEFEIIYGVNEEIKIAISYF